MSVFWDAGLVEGEAVLAPVSAQRSVFTQSSKLFSRACSLIPTPPVISTRHQTGVLSPPCETESDRHAHSLQMSNLLLHQQLERPLRIDSKGVVFIIHEWDVFHTLFENSLSASTLPSHAHIEHAHTYIHTHTHTHTQQA